MEENKGKSLHHYMRVLHRNLGFLAIGMVIIYALSGILLIHRSSSFMKTSTPVEQTIAPNLNTDQLGKQLQMKKFKVSEEKDGIIYFSDEGKYDTQSGKVSYVKKEYPWLLSKFAGLHMAASAQNVAVGIFTTIFGVVLLFLAISSLFMFPRKAKVFRSNMLYTAAGIVISIVLLLVL